jgi:hypothetical protein
MGTFALDINKFIKKCGDNADKVVRKTVLDIGKSLIEKTPVGDATYWESKPPAGYVGGHARANWSHSEGAQNVQEFDGVDPSGSGSNSRIAASIPVKAAGKVHFIQNSVPYIQALEEGHSRQAPNGMAALTGVEFQMMINKAVAELK